MSPQLPRLQPPWHQHPDLWVVRGWWDGGGGQCYLMIMLSHKWREWETSSKGEEREQTQPPLYPRGCFFFPPFSSFSVTWCFCFSQLRVHADKMVIFIVRTALHLHVHLWKGSGTWRNSNKSRWIKISIIPLEGELFENRFWWLSTNQTQTHFLPFAFKLRRKKWSWPNT